MNIDEFSAKYLFEPLGTDSFDWWLRFESGVIEAASGIKMTPRDMVKVGVTYLNEGVWNGKRVISEQWVEKSATAFAVIKGLMSRVQIRRMLAIPIRGGLRPFLIQVKEYICFMPQVGEGNILWSFLN